MPLVSERLEPKIPAAAALLRLAAVLIPAFALGILSRRKVFERDFFWQVRAGLELLQTHHLQRSESWSHTSPGRAWLNVDWLSTVLEALIAKAAHGYEAVPWVRAGLIAVWLGLSLRLCLRSSASALAGMLACFAVAPCAWLTCSTHFQMGPDLLASCLLVVLLNLIESSFSFPQKSALGMALLLVWSNVHPATAPIGILVLLSFVLIIERNRAPWFERAGWGLAATAAWLCNPYGARVGALPFGVTPEAEFWPSPLSIGFIAAAYAAYVLTHRQHADALPGAWRHRAWFLMTSIPISGLCATRPALASYAVPLLLPPIAAALSTALEIAPGQGSSIRMLAWAAAPLLALWGWLLPNRLAFGQIPVGSGVLDTRLPVESVAFLKTISVKPNLLNAGPLGGYLAQELPALPVSSDGRAGLYGQFEDEGRNARKDTVAFAAFLQKWRINVIVDEIPRTIFHPQAGPLDASRLLLPRSEWALVFFDNCSVVYLRRIPEHAAAISRYEYLALQRGLPASYGALTPDLTPFTRLQIRADAQRCARDQPWNIYCHAAMGSYLLTDGRLEDALEEMNRGARLNPLDEDVLAGLKVVYRRLGREADVDAVNARLERVLTADQNTMP